MILTSDWHIWGTAPLFRSEEQDWFKAMERYLREIKRFQRKNGDIPVIIAGDVFDHYNPSPIVINWLLERIPNNVYAIPGQHDLQNHSLELIKKTAFWTLVVSGRISYLEPEATNLIKIGDKTVNIISKPWNYEVQKPEQCDADIQIYVAHQYIYSNQKTCYIDAPEENNIDKQVDFLNFVDVAVFGDNHIPFTYQLDNDRKTKVVNCGTLIRRKVDERSTDCGFYVLYDDLSIEKELFDLSKDVYTSIEKNNKIVDSSNTEELLKELQNLDTISFDYCDEIKKYLTQKKEAKQLAYMEQIFSKYRDSRE